MTAIAPSTLAPLNPPPLERSPLLNLLIVDDDSLVREACREAATALGYYTSTTQFADQALWFIESYAIDCSPS